MGSDHALPSLGLSTVILWGLGLDFGRSNTVNPVLGLPHSGARLAALVLLSILINLSVAAAEKPPPCFIIGTVLAT